MTVPTKKTPDIVISNIAMYGRLDNTLRLLKSPNADNAQQELISTLQAILASLDKKLANPLTLQARTPTSTPSKPNKKI